MKPLISIIVPVYMVEKYIEKCINSILAQTYKNIEVILVDDGSTDKCGEICEEFSKFDNRIRVIHKENGGLSDARNAGLNVAMGEYIGFVDSDDLISPLMFELLVKNSVQYDADIVSCESTSNIQELITENNVSLQYERIIIKNNVVKSYLSFESQSIWRRLYRASLFENVRFEVGEQNEDVMTSYLLMKKCNCFVKIKAKLYYWNMEPTSLSRSPLKTLKNQSERVLVLCEQDEEEETIKAARVRAILFEYRLITRAIRFGFANNQIEKEFNINLPQYLKNMRSYQKEINNSRQFRIIDKIEIKLMLISMSLYKFIYSSLRRFLKDTNY